MIGRRFHSIAIAIAMLASLSAQSPAAPPHDAPFAHSPPSDACRSTPEPTLAVRRFAFPRDDGAHENYPIEWWRTFGRLTDDAGRAFDYSVNVSRFAVGATGSAPRSDASRWSARHVVTTSFALLDDQTLEVKRATYVDRESALGASIADGGTFSIVSRNFTYATNRQAKSTARRFTLSVHDGDGGNALDLDQLPAKAALPLGPGGIVRTGSCPWNQAYAYAYTRNVTHGVLRFAGIDHRVSGSTWIEHEFANQELSAHDVGWSRFEVQFDDGRDLDARFTRDAAGHVVATSGAFVSATGDVTYLAPGSAETRLPPDATVRDAQWHSDASDLTYPAMWYFLVKHGQLALATVEMTHDQELRPAGRTPYYWGAIVVERYGPPGGDRGHGFVELTGYDGRRAL